MIRVLVAEDSPTARALLVAMLDADPGIEVIAQASTGLEAVEMAERLAPDLITMDVHMPELDGLQATERIMLRSPRPIIIVSSQARDADVSLSLDATRAGALLVLPKPEGPGSGHFESDQRQLVAMVKALSHVKVVRRWRGSGSIGNAPPADKADTTIRRQTGTQATRRSGGRPPATLVAIAASTGGPAALKDTLAVLPANFAAPILIVQHIAKGFVDGLAKWLGTDSRLSVKIAADGETPLPGLVYLAPDGRHMEVRKAGSGPLRIALTSTPPVGTFRPSASRLFSSAATAVGDRALAVILTGMGDDGVAGLLEVRRNLGFVLAQDETSSVIYGMPREAVRAGVVDEVVSLQVLPDRLMELT